MSPDPKNAKTFMLQDFADATCISGVPTLLHVDPKPYLHSRNKTDKTKTEWHNVTKGNVSSMNLID